MQIADNTVAFEPYDAAFVQRFGVTDATDMVLDYRSVCPLPFIYDTCQLAAFFGLNRAQLFRLTKTADRAYRSISLPKKNGKTRQLHAPNKSLKACQHRILHDILVNLPVSSYATAYAKERRLTDNALPHVGKRYLLKLDITDFFGSIRFEQVYTAAFCTRYFPKQIGTMLTTLCCRKDVLPQGAPTSPALSNLVMRAFDEHIGRWCEQRGVSYTRYCDDMTFSSDKPLFAAYCKAKAMLEDMGLELNEQKTRFLTRAARQSVTGLTVNERVAVAADCKRALRQEVYYALKYGLGDSILRADRAAFLCDGHPEEEKYYNHLVGRIRFVLQIEPDNPWFQNALNQLQHKNPAG